MEQGSRPHFVILISPGLGHLIPFVELTSRLFHHHHFGVTFIAHRIDPPSPIEQSILDSLPKGVDVVSFSQIPVEELPPGSKYETRVVLSVISNLPRLRSLLATIPSVRTLVMDLFCAPAFDVAKELVIPPYLFFTSSCTALSLAFHLPTLNASFKGDYRDMPEPVRLPGCVPIPGKDLPLAGEDRSNQNGENFIRILNKLFEAKGILVNSSAELEPGPSKALREGKQHPPIYPIGPLVRPVTHEPDQNHDCLKWLNNQPEGSVLYVSFGSGGMLSRAQTTELALALEMSGTRFLWVAKIPNDQEACATFFNVDSSKDPLHFLPERFIERTKGRGLVIPFWAPQVAILRHPAIGGFVTHCGWNSSLEALTSGVPLIAWPLYAEQRLNAVQLAEDAKVAMRLREREDGVSVFEKEEIARVVKGLMEGDEGKRVRKRAKELSEAASHGLVDGGGVIISEVARVWKEHK